MHEIRISWPLRGVFRMRRAERPDRVRVVERGDIPDLIRRLYLDQRLWYRMSPSHFEGVVAELLASFGWEVNVARQTRDSAIDILGITHDATGFQTSWIVECKRYAREQPIGASVVRELNGVQRGLGVPRAILATTSRLTPEAASLSRQLDGVSVADLSVLNEWIARYAGLASGAPHADRQRFESCFVSYSTHDKDFARELVSRLREKDVRVWFAPDAVRLGDRIYERIVGAIDAFDKVIVVLSEASIRSRWVHSEIERVRRRERRDGSHVLFPVAVVPPAHIVSKGFASEADREFAMLFRRRLISDFTNWRQPDEFGSQVEVLLQSLRHDE
jgi:hypothetical protein